MRASRRMQRLRAPSERAFSSDLEEACSISPSECWETAKLPSLNKTRAKTAPEVGCTRLARDSDDRALVCDDVRAHRGIAPLRRPHAHAERSRNLGPRELEAVAEQDHRAVNRS